MAEKYKASMPPGLHLNNDWQLQLIAVDPTTGANVANVTVSGVAIVAEPMGAGAPGAVKVGPFMLVPGPGA